jgi:quercetin dioxygenase-like cupin family protein
MSDRYVFMQDLSALLPEIAPDSIVSRTFYSDEQVKAMIFGFAPGQELSEHTASMPALIHILSGEATLTLGGETHTAGPGTWVRMEANLAHSVLAHTPVVMLLLMLPGGKVKL